MWSEWGVSSSVFTVDRTLYCASGVCPGGRSWRGYSAVNSVYSSTLSLFDKWEPRLIPTLHAATLPTQHFNAPAKNRPDFLKTSYLFTARLQSPVLSLPLCCIDFLLTKKNPKQKPLSSLPQLWQRSPPKLLHLYTVLEEQFGTQRQYICLTVILR